MSKVSWSFPVFFLVSTLSAQSLPPALFVKGDEGVKSLGLSRVETNVRIFGGLAETTVTMTFANNLPGVMEGDLFFPLPEGSTVSGYALDINGMMVDGVSVPKDRGRQVFEEIVRNSRDPGLVEWTRGNTFKTRVYPIPGHGSRTVRVSYISELAPDKEGAVYRLPLGFKQSLPDFSLRVEVGQHAQEPRVTVGKVENISFVAQKGDFIAETRLRNATLAEDLAILLPGKLKPQVMVEQAEDGTVFFAVSDVPPRGEVKQEKAAPKHVIVYWDTSGSRGTSNHDREIRLLKEYFKSQVHDGRSIRVDLVPFNIAPLPTREMTLTDCELDQLSAELEKIRYDGGTQISAIPPSAGNKPPDFYLLFTDGNANFGKLTLPVFDAPIYVFANDLTADHFFLRRLASVGGGRYFNLEEAKEADVVAAIGQPPYCCQSVSVEGGEATELYPKLPQPVDGRFTLVGKLESPQAKITLDYGIEGKVRHKSTLIVNRAEAAKGRVLRSFWAQKKLADLMVLAKRNEPAIADLGRDFGLVTPYTSLIVLESLAQYLQYEIEPPRSLPTMRADYLEQIKNRGKEQKKSQADQLEEVVRKWQQHVGWWEQKFDYPADFKNRSKEGVQNRNPERYSSYRKHHREHYLDRNSGGGGFGMGGMGGKNGASGAYAAGYRGAPGRIAGMGGMPGMTGERGGMLGGMGGMGGMNAAGGGGGAAGERGQPAGLGGAAGVNARPPAAQPADAPAAAAAPIATAAPRSPYDMRPRVSLQDWEPSASTANEYRAAPRKDRFAVYLKKRAKNADSPGFYLDSAECFRLYQDPDNALQILSNLAELDNENADLMRILAQELERLGYLDLAVLTFEEILRQRPDEPQSYRDLALALVARAREAEHPSAARGTKKSSRATAKAAALIAARDDYARAIDVWHQMITKRWDGKYADVELIALEEVNAIIAAAKQAGVEEIPLDNRLVKLLDEDFRVVLTWNIDNATSGLRITEPSGEQAEQNHGGTTIGGVLLGRLVKGDGLEEYAIRRAMHGKFKVEVAPNGTGPETRVVPAVIRVDMFTNFGRPNETHEKEFYHLYGSSQRTRTIGKVDF